MNISQETAAQIWNAHREINAAHKLLENLESALKEGRDPTPLKQFGNGRRKYELSVPMDEQSSRLLDVDVSLVPHIVTAQIAKKRQVLAEACIKARMELEGLSHIAEAFDLKTMKPCSTCDVVKIQRNPEHTCDADRIRVYCACGKQAVGPTEIVATNIWNADVLTAEEKRCWGCSGDIVAGPVEALCATCKKGARVGTEGDTKG